MTGQELTNALEQYRAGLETEITLLDRLEAVAGRQRAVSEVRDFERLAAESDERDRLTATLVTVEQGLRAMRDSLAAARSRLARLPAYADVLRLRSAAAERVGRILAADRLSLKALADADLARRAAVASLERGETTLAAYRKVLAPPVSSASLVNRHG